MSTLLRIDASSRHDGSWSRRYGDALVASLAPTRVIARDLATDPVPHLSARAAGAFFTDPATHDDADRAALALSETLLAEITAADDIVLTVPMYNFGVPSALKAWIDQVVRVGRTFAFDGQSFAGLLEGKRAFLVVAYGADGYTEGDMQAADFVTPYLRFVLGFIGITDVTLIPVEGMNVGREAQAEARAQAAIDGVVMRRFAA